TDMQHQRQIGNRVYLQVMRDPRLTKLASVLVRYSVNVQKNQLVRLWGPPLSLPLLTELYRETLAVGAHPFVRIKPEELAELLVKHGDDEQLKFLNPLEQAEYETADVSVGIWGEENTKAMSSCDPKRIGMMEAARKPLMDIFMK